MVGLPWGKRNFYVWSVAHCTALCRYYWMKGAHRRPRHRGEGVAITDWPEGERPREKLLGRGPQALSDAELLAIFLRTGVAGKSAVDLARELLSDFGSLRALLRASKEDFCARYGLGEAKYVQLQAVMEIGRRHLGESLTEKQALKDPAEARSFLCSQLRDLDHEAFGALFLDSQHRALAFEVLARGTLNEASVYPREVVKQT